MNEDINRMKAHWHNEKDAIQEIRRVKEELEHIGKDEQQAEREGDLARVAEIRYGKSTDLKNQLDKARENLANLQTDRKMLKEEVDDEDIAQVISSWTGIPVRKMLEGEREKLIILWIMLILSSICSQPVKTFSSLEQLIFSLTPPPF